MAYMYAMINKETLVHICTSKRVSNQYILSKTKVKMDKLEKWLNPLDSSFPTINKAKELATCLHIPFAALYMNSQDIPIANIPSIRNMRMLYDNEQCDDSAINIAMIDLLMEKDYLVSMQEELGIDWGAEFEPFVPDSSEPYVWANEIRDYFDLDMEEQYKCTSTRQFYLYLREQVEKKGVFVHCFTDVSLEEARGIAIYDKNIPIIGINEEDRPPAKSFSIIHELVHLYKRESSLCNTMFNRYEAHLEEIFCNAVAGELLVPQIALKKFIRDEQLTFPYDVKDIEKMASKFSVSREVIIRRMLDTGEIGETEYNSYSDLFRIELEKEKEEQRIARREGRKMNYFTDMSRIAFDRTSYSVCVALYQGYCDNIYSKRDVANHVRIDQKHIDKFLTEVSKWVN